MKVWVENNAIMKILVGERLATLVLRPKTDTQNSTMDFVQDDLEEKFVFENPQIKQKCGCGKSWQT